MSDLVKRIAAEEIEAVKPWVIPTVASKKTIAALKNKPSARGSSTEENPPKNQTEKLDENNTENPEIIEDVEIEDATVEPITAEQLQEITEAAEKEGYEAGFKKGLEEGTEQGLSDAAEQAKNKERDEAKTLQSLIDKLLNPLEAEYQQVEQQMLEMVCELTRAVTQKELLSDSSSIQGVVNESLGLLNQVNASTTLYLNSQDIELVTSSLSLNETALTIEEDNALLPGGCRLENNETRIDHSINQKLDALLDNFVHKRYPDKQNSPLDNDTLEQADSPQMDDEDNTIDHPNDNNTDAKLKP